MKIYKYKDYNDYVKAQQECTHRKLKVNPVWATRENIETIAITLEELIPEITFGICHGSRMGFEQTWFSDFLHCKVIGTEISPEAEKFPNTIVWDFHEVKEEWIGNVDFIYSNSLDHSCKPVECLQTWMSCLKEGGICVLEWCWSHNVSSRNDPFAASLAEYEAMISEWDYQMIRGAENRTLIFIKKGKI